MVSTSVEHAGQWNRFSAPSVGRRECICSWCGSEVQHRGQYSFPDPLHSFEGCVVMGCCCPTIMGVNSLLVIFGVQDDLSPTWIIWVSAYLGMRTPPNEKT